MRLFACAIAAALALLSYSPAAAASPTPAATPRLPSKALHVDLQVEVNKLGQVVRVLHGNLSGDTAFDTMTMGNALQMWIRDERGSKVTAIAGLYRVSYNYNPATRGVRRGVALLSRGGSWTNEPGAATKMLADAQKQAEQTLARLRAEQKKKQEEQSKNLPDINSAVRKSKATPSPPPKP